MKSFYIGPDGARLYCNLHVAKTRLVRDAGVVLCCPLGHEYYRSYRAYVRLAEHLAEHGFSVLRFDYLGTGDSEGASGHARLEGWVRDAVTAAQTLKENTGCGSVVFIGMRFGAVIAAMAAHDATLPASTVLWDPVMDGAGYVTALDELHRRLLNDLERFPFPRDAGDSLASEYVGYVYGTALLEDLRAVTLARALDGTIRTGLVMTRDAPDGIAVQARKRLPHGGYGWSEPGRVGETIVDPAANRHVAAALEEVAA